MTYAELLAGQALEHELDRDATLLEPSEFRVMGETHLRRLDAIGRVTGAAQYSQDIQPDGVLFASVIRPVAYGATAPEDGLTMAFTVSVAFTYGLIY